MKKEALSNHLISQLYKSIWETTRNWERNVIHYIAVLITAIAIIGYAFYNIETKPFLIFPATIIAQLALFWMLFVNAEAAYQYRSLQALSIKIEKDFAKSEFQKILPAGYQKIKSKFPDIHNIHSRTFLVLISFLSIGWIYFVLQYYQEQWKYIIVLASYLMFFGKYLLFNRKRQKKFIENFGNSATNHTKSSSIQ